MSMHDNSERLGGPLATVLGYAHGEALLRRECFYYCINADELIVVSK